MDGRSRSEMSDSEFLRHVAHTAEIGDPIEERDIDRIREIADKVQHEFE